MTLRGRSWAPASGYVIWCDQECNNSDGDQLLTGTLLRLLHFSFNLLPEEHRICTGKDFFEQSPGKSREERLIHGWSDQKLQLLCKAPAVQVSRKHIVFQVKKHGCDHQSTMLCTRKFNTIFLTSLSSVCHLLKKVWPMYLWEVQPNKVSHFLKCACFVKTEWQAIAYTKRIIRTCGGAGRFRLEPGCLISVKHFYIVPRQFLTCFCA